MALRESERRRLAKKLHLRMQRQMEALNIYRAMPRQEEFHASTAAERLAMGSNRGGKAQPVDEPVLTPNGWVEIGCLGPGDVVIGGDGLPCVVTGVYPQGVKDVLRVEFVDGGYTRCCREHLWRIKTANSRFYSAGDWEVLSAQEIVERWGEEPEPAKRPIIPTCVPWMPRREVPLDPYVLGLFLGDGSFTGTGASFSTADSELVLAVEGSLDVGYGLRKSKHHGKESYDYFVTKGRGNAGRNVFLEAIRSLGLWGCRSWEKKVPASYLFNTPDVRLAVLQGLMDTDGTISDGRVSFATTSPALAEGVVFLVRSLGGKASLGSWKRKSYKRNGERALGRPSVNVMIRMDECPFRLPRKVERWQAWYDQAREYPGRIWKRAVPDGRAECVCIAVSSPDHTYVTRDCIVTHNTLCTMVEVARAALNRDPYDKYPKKGGRIVLVGFDETHIGQVFYEYLFKAGRFKMVYDHEKMIWRSWNRLEEPEREKDVKPAGPLIPRRYLAEEPAWKDKKKRVPTVVRLITGWELLFFSSKSDPPRGIDVDLAVFDEEISDPNFYPEISARLVDRKGKFIWSATPQVGTDQLTDMEERAEDPDDPSVQKFHLTLKDNEHIEEVDKQLLAKKYASNPQEYKVRIEGKSAAFGLRLYPTFSMSEVMNGVRSVDVTGVDLEGRIVDKDLYREWKGDYNRYMVVDPGRGVSCALFFAVPPPWSRHAGRRFLYDQRYVREATAGIFADAVAPVIMSDVFMEFIMDPSAFRPEVGSGMSPVAYYTTQMEKHGLVSSRTGSGFVAGINSLKVGLLEANEWVVPNYQTGICKLGVFDTLDPHDGFLWEIVRYKRKRQGQVILDIPVDRNDHAMDCFRYFVMRNPEWEKNPASTRQGSYPHRFFDQWKREMRAMYGGESYVNIGPGG